MDKYKSWKELKKQLEDALCKELKGRVTYFLTRYHDVHNSYGRAAVRVDGEDAVTFSWIEMRRADCDIWALSSENENLSTEEIKLKLKDKWDANCTYCDMDFLKAVLQFRNMDIREALCSDNLIIRVFAIMDKRVGKRTLEKIRAEGAYFDYPEWVRKFFELRIILSTASSDTD